MPPDHPPHQIKGLADAALGSIGAALDAYYDGGGRPSIAPERLLKDRLLIQLYSVRSDLGQTRSDGLPSTEYITGGGTLIEALGSPKSLRRQDGADGPPPGANRSGISDWNGGRRSNATHASSTDPEARLMRWGNGQSAKLSCGAHALMDKRRGLRAGLALTDPARAEHRMAQSADCAGGAAALAAQDRRCRQRLLRVRVHHALPLARYRATCSARTAYLRTPGLDARTVRQAGYAASQRKGKRVEDIFDCMKNYEGFRKTPFVGQAGFEPHALRTATDYNLLRMAKLTRQGRCDKPSRGTSAHVTGIDQSPTTRNQPVRANHYIQDEHLCGHFASGC
jgi:hypothetical protein